MMENRLQERRLELGMTQPQVSERLRATEPRCDVGMVSRYEKGVCLPTKEQLSSLEVLYGIPMTEIYRKVVRVEPPSHLGRVRKCYRISQAFASSLPDDLLQVCGYSSWQSWHDAALKRLLGEYAARKRAGHQKNGGKIA